MLNHNITIETGRCRCLHYIPLKPNQNNPLVGSWSVTEELVDEFGEFSTDTEIYAFYRNGVFKWTEIVDGVTLIIERGTYTISGNRLFTNYSKNNISEEAFFCVIDNKLSVQFDVLESPIIFTKSE